MFCQGGAVYLEPRYNVICRGIFESYNIEFDKLERIENIEIQDGHIIYAELLINGERLIFGTHSK